MIHDQKITHIRILKSLDDPLLQVRCVLLGEQHCGSVGSGLVSFHEQLGSGKRDVESVVVGGGDGGVGIVGVEVGNLFFRRKVKTREQTE